jgi:hypothetical protein
VPSVKLGDGGEGSHLPPNGKGTYLMGMHLMDMHLMGRVSHRPISYRQAPYGRASHRVWVSWAGTSRACVS